MFRKKKKSIEEQTLEYLKKHEFDLARYLIATASPKDERTTKIAMILLVLWCWLSIFAVTIWSIS